MDPLTEATGEIYQNNQFIFCLTHGLLGRDVPSAVFCWAYWLKLYLIDRHSAEQWGTYVHGFNLDGYYHEIVKYRNRKSESNVICQYVC